jgi:hypothetical protein
VDIAEKIRNWLRVQANAETDPKVKDAFIEAHNATIAILSGKDGGG